MLVESWHWAITCEVRPPALCVSYYTFCSNGTALQRGEGDIICPFNGVVIWFFFWALCFRGGFFFLYIIMTAIAPRNRFSSLYDVSSEIFLLKFSSNCMLKINYLSWQGLHISIWNLQRLGRNPSKICLQVAFESEHGWLHCTMIVKGPRVSPSCGQSSWLLLGHLSSHDTFRNEKLLSYSISL